MKIESLKPGMVVYSVTRGLMGNTTVRETRVHEVYIKSVDVESQTVMAKWNYNPESKFYRKSWSNWRLKKPILVGMIGKRIATKAEVAAMKERGELT